jgi:hypothetical protein
LWYFQYKLILIDLTSYLWPWGYPVYIFVNKTMSEEYNKPLFHEYIGIVAESL